MLEYKLNTKPTEEEIEAPPKVVIESPTKASAFMPNRILFEESKTHHSPGKTVTSKQQYLSPMKAATENVSVTDSESTAAKRSSEDTSQSENNFFQA